MRRTRAPVRRALGVAALVLVSALLAVGLAELVLRVAAPQPASWLALYRRHPTLPFHALLPDAHFSVETGETRWRVDTDAQGFRIGPSPRPPARCTALWLGDSFAFGHGVDWDDSFVGLVEARTPDYRQRNAAVPGYGPVQYREVLEQLIADDETFDRLLVVIYLGNDFHDCVWNKDVQVREGVIGYRGDWKSLLKTRLHLYRLVSAAWHRLAPEPESPYQRVLDELGDPTAWESGTLARAAERFAQEMARIRELAGSRGAEVGFVIVPTQQAVAAERGERSEAAGSALLPVARARAALAQIDARFFDATGVLAADPPARLFFPFDGHLDPEGNRRVAEGLLTWWAFDCPERDTPQRQAGIPSRGAEPR
jgi:hypothetical protein